jgi:broad specificity phosphatase PhoE
VRAKVRLHALQRVAHPILDPDGVQPVQQQQVLDELVGGERRGLQPADALDDPLQTRAVELEHRLHRLEPDVARGRVTEGLELLEEPLDPTDQLAVTHASAAGVLAAEHRRVHLLERPAAAQVHVHAAGQARVEGPHRPHDVDAAEVVGPFSSKIGWPATASS